MKKYIFLLAITAVLYSCESESLPTYSGTDQVYFSFADNTLRSLIVDATIVHFGYDVVEKTDSIIGIPVKIQGSVQDFDRPVKFTVVDTFTTAKSGADFELLPEFSLIPAGKISGRIFVKIKNTGNLKDTTFVVGLILQENEYFKADFEETQNPGVNKDGNISGIRYKIFFDNTNEIPNMWTSTYAAAFNQMFGTYSKVKFALMCEILPGCTRAYFTYIPPETAAQVFTARFPMALFAAWAMILNNYLENYKLEHDGNPLLDENGIEVKSGNTYK